MKILIVNGPNLNLLGRRQPEIYGSRAMDDILDEVRDAFPGVEINYYQSNHEGALIDKIQEAGYDPAVRGIVLNAGGYTHTSVALADAVAAVPAPVIEVHLSNIAAREDFRRTSLLEPVCRGTISGLGPAVYELAVRALSAL